MQTTQNISKSLAQVLATYCEKNNIRKDTDVLDAMLTDYAKTLDLDEVPIPELNIEPKPEKTEDLISDKHLEALNLKKLG